MDFYKRLQAVGERIPYGSVTTYGQLSLLCGKPGNARQVGHALRCDLAGEDFPAHRVVNSRGFPSGAPAFSYPDEQRLLLEGEGVVTVQTESGWQVDLDRFGWKPSLMEAEDLRKLFEERGI